MMSAHRGTLRRIAAALATAWLALSCASLHASSVTYQHDARGRLTKATYDDGTIVNTATMPMAIAARRS